MKRYAAALGIALVGALALRPDPVAWDTVRPGYGYGTGDLPDYLGSGPEQPPSE